LGEKKPGESALARFYFTSFDCNEPPHLHVERDSNTCKFWLRPVSLASNQGFGPRELNVTRAIIEKQRKAALRLGMSIVASSEARIQEARVTRSEIVARLVDGRVISVPIAWSWRLEEAKPEQRSHFRIIGSGRGIHWPDLDEDISAEGMLHGVPAPRNKVRSNRNRTSR
jgi:hypothetical protein